MTLQQTATSKTLSSLDTLTWLRNVWRNSPAATASKWATPTWSWEKHLGDISFRVKDCLHEPLRLIVSMPPRHGKSELISHWLPIWYLMHRPQGRVVVASYEARFAETWGRKARDTIRNTSGLGMTVRPDADAASAWLLDSGGGMFTTGVGGPLSGRGADLLIVDDPIKNWAEARSEVYRQNTLEWFRSTAYTRLEPGGSCIVVMTRWHEDDLAGQLEQLDGWETMTLPAVSEEDDAMGRPPGHALWPARYPLPQLLETKAQVGEQVWAGLYQQRPAPLEGGMFQRADWQMEERKKFPPIESGVAWRGWDLAADPDGDYAVGVLMQKDDEGLFWVHDVVREQVTPRRLEALILQTAHKDGPHVLISLPQDPGQAGKVQAEALVSLLAGFGASPSPESGDKELRAVPYAAQVGNGKVMLPKGAVWVDAYINELASFPNGKYDDQVDASSRAFGQLVQYNRIFVV